MDRDVLFTSKDWTNFCTVNNISQSMSSAYHPETVGQSEIANKSIIAILRAKLLEQGIDWLSAVPSVQVAINTSLDASRDATLHTLCFRFLPKFEKGVIVPASSLRPDGISNTLWGTVKTKFVQSCVSMTQQANKRCQPSPSYQVGQQVKVSSSCFPKDTQFNKLEPVFIGPYKILRCFPDTDNYAVEIPFAPAGSIMVHTFLLAPWLDNPDDKFPSRTHTNLGPVNNDATATRYELERIIKHRFRKDKSQFLIKWLGYGHQHNSWQDQEDIDPEAVKAYWESTKWSGNLQKRCRNRVPNRHV